MVGSVFFLIKMNRGDIMKLRGEKGQAMVEFALVIIPLFIIIGGIIDFGWIFYHKVMINNAAREGARYAAIHSKDTTYDTDTETLVKGILPASFIQPTDPVSVIKDSPATGDVTVAIKGDVDILTPFISMIFTDSNTDRAGKQLGISAKTIMKME